MKTILVKRYPQDAYAYFCGKEYFIQKIIKKSGFNDCLLIQISTPLEQKQYYHICQKQSLDVHLIRLSNLHTLRLAFAKGTQFVGVAKLHILKPKQETLEFLAIDTPYQHKNYEHTFLQLIKQWLNQKEI
ncbi:MAG: hypothetical protein NQ127_03965 [Candidatus Cardinium sp.]|nr:hypothetical protein [Candidatus Cardinium sp.]